MCLAIPGKIIEISGDDPLMRTGKVDFGGIFKIVYLAYAPSARLNDYVLVHAGFAISIVNPEEAGRVFDDLREMAKLSAKEDQSKLRSGPAS